MIASRVENGLDGGTGPSGAMGMFYVLLMQYLGGCTLHPQSLNWVLTVCAFYCKLYLNKKGRKEYVAHKSTI